MSQHEDWTEQFDSLCRESAIRSRSFYPDFRRGWDALLYKASQSEDLYFDPDAGSVFTVPCSFGGMDTVFHFDQLKMADWYYQEVKRGKRLVFVPKRVRRDRQGRLRFHDSPCHYDPQAAEPALKEEDRNILAAALPGQPPELWIVYGNKWVERKLSPFTQRSLSLFLIQTDYVPAFLASPWEICLYLFWMDCCILKEDADKVPDEQLKPLLHLFKPSPMLKIKGLL